MTEKYAVEYYKRNSDDNSGSSSDEDIPSANAAHRLNEELDDGEHLSGNGEEGFRNDQYNAREGDYEERSYLKRKSNGQDDMSSKRPKHGDYNNRYYQQNHNRDYQQRNYRWTNRPNDHFEHSRTQSKGEPNGNGYHYLKRSREYPPGAGRNGNYRDGGRDGRSFNTDFRKEFNPRFDKGRGGYSRGGYDQNRRKFSGRYYTDGNGYDKYSSQRMHHYENKRENNSSSRSNENSYHGDVEREKHSPSRSRSPSPSTPPQVCEVYPPHDHEHSPNSHSTAIYSPRNHGSPVTENQESEPKEIERTDIPLAKDPQSKNFFDELNETILKSSKEIYWGLSCDQNYLRLISLLNSYVKKNDDIKPTPISDNQQLLSQSQEASFSAFTRLLEILFSDNPTLPEPYDKYKFNVEPLQPILMNAEKHSCEYEEMELDILTIKHKLQDELGD